MNIIDPIIGEYQHEAATTRRLLERVPEDKFDWKPHQKSMSLRQLVSHIAEISSWSGAVFDMDVFDLDPNYVPFAAQSRQELLDAFDKNVNDTVAKMTGQSNDRLMSNWKMTMAGNTVFEMPRVAVVRAFLLSHMIHHRGQLSVYLRLHDVPIPSIYGPSADEQG